MHSQHTSFSISLSLSVQSFCPLSPSSRFGKQINKVTCSTDCEGIWCLKWLSVTSHTCLGLQTNNGREISLFLLFRTFIERNIRDNKHFPCALLKYQFMFGRSNKFWKKNVLLSLKDQQIKLNRYYSFLMSFNLIFWIICYQCKTKIKVHSDAKQVQ